MKNYEMIAITEIICEKCGFVMIRCPGDVQMSLPLPAKIICKKCNEAIFFELPQESNEEDKNE